MKKSVVIAHQVDRSTATQSNRTPILEVLPKFGERLAVAEHMIDPCHNPIDVRRTKLTVRLVTPVSFNEPCVDLGDERDLGLQEKAGAASGGLRDVVGTKGLD